MIAEKGIICVSQLGMAHHLVSSKYIEILNQHLSYSQTKGIHNMVDKHVKNLPRMDNFNSPYRSV